MADERFRHVEDEYFLLRGQLETGRITQAQFEAALKEMMFQDAQGRYWMIGAASGKWYVHDGAQWVEANPPDAGPPPPPNLAQPPALPTGQKARGANRNRNLLIGVLIAVCICIALVLGISFVPGVLNIDLATALGLKPQPRIIVVVPGATETQTLAPTNQPTRASLSATATSRPQVSPTALASTATNGPPTLALSATFTRVPTSAPIIPTATLAPTNSPVPSFPPGVYVTNLRSDPAQPKRNQGVAFIATFVNTTGVPQNYNWLVQVYDPSNTKKSVGESAALAISVPVGTTDFRSADNWTVTGPGGCVDLFAQTKFRTPDNNVVSFTNTDGSVVSFGFQVCP